MPQPHSHHSVSIEATGVRDPVDMSLNIPQISYPSDQLQVQDVIFSDTAEVAGSDGMENGTEPLTSPDLVYETPIGASQVLPFGDFDDYLMFLDDTPLPTQVFSSISQFEQPLPSFSPDPMIFMRNTVQHNFDNYTDVNTHLEPADESAFSRFGSRLPSLQPEDQSQPALHPKSRSLSFSEVTVESRSKLCARLEKFRPIISNKFALPTRHALSRYLGGYVTGFHEHLPFLHVSTISILTSSIELILAIAAVGAQYCREPDKSVQIFQVAKAIAMESIRNRDREDANDLGTSKPTLVSQSQNDQDNPDYVSPNPGDVLHAPSSLFGKPIETAQALLLFMAMATWFEHKPLARAAMTIRSQLESLIHDEGLGLEILGPDVTWQAWIRHEGSKRTKFIIYCFFNLHCVTFDIPPLILNQKIGMNLPCSEA